MFFSENGKRNLYLNKTAVKIGKMHLVLKEWLVKFSLNNFGKLYRNSVFYYFYRSVTSGKYGIRYFAFHLKSYQEKQYNFRHEIIY